MTLISYRPANKTMLLCSSSHAHIFDMPAQLPPPTHKSNIALPLPACQLCMHESTLQCEQLHANPFTGCSSLERNGEPSHPNDLLLFLVKGQYSFMLCQTRCCPLAKSSSLQPCRPGPDLMTAPSPCYKYMPRHAMESTSNAQEARRAAGRRSRGLAWK